MLVDHVSFSQEKDICFNLPRFLPSDLNIKKLRSKIDKIENKIYY